eukprot:CAMPEP_0117623440 /NCGR_PEP_ID=MMETSP0784-20121206/88648_1 /TAXON_ID=39447 /ORGANISM="" /LENGTH=498 /DNA_ID=CAMNT_0005427391 /DNA_START=35 /DNA_END=1532 /DNA_ORIENTATION=+
MAVLARVLCALVCGGCLCAQAGATLAQRPSSRRSLRSSEAAVTTASSQISKACDATPDPRSRVMLMMVVAAYHGSTSAEQLLMSSSNVATLCGALSWQCEGFRIEEFRRLPSRWRKATEDPWFPRSGRVRFQVLGHQFRAQPFRYVLGLAAARPPREDARKDAGKFSGAGAQCVTDGSHAGPDEEERQLSRFATYWDLRRPVLLEKTPERMQGNFLEQELSALLTAPMPDLMKKKAAQPFRYVLGLAAARPPREDARKDAGKFSGAGAQCVTDGSHAGPDEEERQLSRFATYWDLRRPVLLEKTPERMQGNFLEQELSALLTAPMPDLMKKNGIERIQPAYLILWRPACLAKLSSHTQDWVKESSRAHLARMELRILEHQMHIHRHLHNLSIPVLVVNLGNLMWDSQSEIDRIKDFLPCAGPLDPAFVPKLGKDMYKENSWKARGSLDDFARSIDPKSCCEYDVAQRRCGRSTDMLTTLQGNARLRAQSAQEYLQAFS